MKSHWAALVLIISLPLLSLTAYSQDWQIKIDELNNRAMNASLEGRSQEALTLYQQGLTIAQREKLTAIEPIQLQNIAGVYSGAGRYDKAVEFHQKMLAIYRAANDQDGVKQTLSSLGADYHGMCNLDKSKCQTAIDYYREADMHDRYIANIYFSWALIFDDKGIIGIDKEKMLQAVQYYKKGMSNGPDMMRELAEQELAQAYLHLKQYHDSAQQFEKVEQTTDQDFKNELLATNDPLLAIAYIKSANPDKAFDFMERTTARKLAEQLDIPESAFAGITSYQQQMPPESAVIRIGYIQNGYGQQHRKPIQVVVNNKLIKGYELEKYQFVEAIKPKVPQAVGFIDRLRKLNVVDDIKPMDDRERRDDVIRPRDKKAFDALIASSEFAMLDIRQGGVLSDLEFDAIVIYYRQLLMQPALSASEKGVRELISRQLYELIFKPIEDQLNDKRQLIIIPDGVLAFLPFETLRMPDGRYLVERFDIRYSPSLTISEWIKARKHPQPSKPILALGGASYSHAGEVERGTQPSNLSPEFEKRYLANLKQDQNLQWIYSELGLSAWGELPGTLAEVKALREIFTDARILTGNEVKEETIKALSNSGELANYQRLHFATHGIVLPEFPELSAIVLSQNQTENSGEDGYFSVREISKVKLSADFVNLSACDTGLGKISRGEGVSGLAQAFLVAGAKGVSVSLWQIADDPTMKFMKLLYQQQENRPMPYWQAMASVKRMFIQGRLLDEKANEYDLSEPFFWAPFVFYGE